MIIQYVCGHYVGLIRQNLGKNGRCIVHGNTIQEVIAKGIKEIELGNF